MTDSATRPSTWELGPFTPHARAILGADPHLTFSCPVTGARVPWAAKDVFNPGAVVHDGNVHLLVRAEDQVGPYAGTSRIGLAVSRDGMDFTLEPEPVIYPADDAWGAWEWPGGCEDPRVVESPDGGFVCVYTAFDGKSATLFVATSPDLRVWQKHGPALADTRHAKRWSKSGSIVTEVRDGRLVAARIDDRFWMYWGEGVCFAATSDDLVRWEPLEYDTDPDRYVSATGGRDGTPVRWRVHAQSGTRALRPLLFPRPGRFDSLLVEPGPPAVCTTDGVVLLYNGANHPRTGDPSFASFAYQPGQVLFDRSDPAACIARSMHPFLTIGANGAAAGQVDNVCFAQALVQLDGQWVLYFGMADSRIGAATASVV